MGSKRVGLARTQALIENLKRELNLGGSQLAGVKDSVLTTTADATTTLTAADSGKVIMMTPNASAIALPDAAPGLSFKIILADDYSTASCTVTAKAGEFFAGHAIAMDSNHGNEANGSSHLVATFGSATLAGDYLYLHCNGSLWFVNGASKVKNNGIVFSDS